MEAFQIIPILSLALYFVYLVWYYALPMLFLRILLFYGHLRYRGSFISFRNGQITVEYRRNGKVHTLVRPLDVDPTSRFLAMDVCAEFRKVLRDIRRGAAEETEEHSE